MVTLRMPLSPGARSPRVQVMVPPPLLPLRVVVLKTPLSLALTKVT